ncbi:retention module-containing protein [Neptuniibacter sp. QD48_11]|uniref:retention module-containing protein n=1 Tax=Neptuniibacter sp. QD48_11 TaxID=3398211 RepID=UPI0039F62346
MSVVIGSVSQISGKVVAISPDGSERILALGDPVYEDDLIKVSQDGSIEIDVNNAESVALESGQVWLVSSETFSVIENIDPSEYVVNPEFLDSALAAEVAENAEEAAELAREEAAAAEAAGETFFDQANADAEAEAEAIQAAILAGVDPTEVGEATAAGGEPAAGGDGGNEGSSTVNITRTAEEVDPTAGYDTIGIEDTFEDPVEEELQPIITPNNIPVITVNELGIDGSDDVVNEAGLPEGRNPEDNTEFAFGSFTISDADGLFGIQSVTINGATTPIGELVGSSFDGDYGVMTITAYDSNTGIGSYQYELTSPVTTDPSVNDGANTELNKDTFSFTVSDGMNTSAPSAVTIDIIDDVPDSEVVSDREPELVMLDESPLPEEGDGIHEVSVDFSAAFVAPTQYGADGPGSVSYALVLTGANVGTGLFALGEDGQQGAEIVLNMEGANVVGTSGSGTEDDPLITHFTISVDNDFDSENFGTVTFTLENNIWHSDKDEHDEAETLNVHGSYFDEEQEEILNSLVLEQTITDADGDIDSASVDIGSGTFSIEDDGPTAQLRTPDEGEQPATLVLDESALPEDGDGINTVTEDFSVYFVTDSEGDDETGDLDVDYGTDGPGSVTYSLALSAAGLATQLYALDPSDTETVDDPYGQGDEILLFMNEETGVVEGKTSAESETVYFSISVDENSGEVTFERYENIWHDNTGDHDDPESLQLDELATLKLTQTVEDADGDESAVSINLIGSDSDGDAVTSFTIEDDGPVGSGSSNDASYTGNVLVDAGTDGATVAWSGSTSNGTFSGNEEGGYSYSSTVDDADYAAGTILYDTVSYTITDADGDTTSGSLTFTYEVQNLEPEISVSGESTSLLLDESIGEDINDENAEDDDAGESDPFIGSVSANLAPLFSYTIDDYGNQSDPGSATASESYGLSLTTESEDGFVETTLQRSSDDETVYLYQGEDGIVYGVTLDGEGEIDATVLSIEVDSDTATLTVNQYVAVEHGDAEDHDDSVSLNLVEDTDLLEVTYLASYSDEDGSPASADTAFTLASVDVGNISIEDDGPTAQLRTPDEGEQPATLVLDESALPEDGDGINTVTEDFSVYFVTDSEGDDETGDLDVDYGTDGPGSVTYSLALSAAGLATQLYALDPSDTETVDDPYGQGDEILLFMNEETGVVEGKTSAESETVYFSISVDENSGEVTFERYENIWHDNTGDHDDPESLQLDELATLKLTQTVEDADGDESAVSINLIGSDSDGDAVTSFTIEDDGPVGSGSSNDASYTGNVLVDAGTDGATVAWSGSTSNGTFSGNEEGGYSYSSTVDDADYAAGTILYDTVSYTITDADGDTTSGSLTFTYEVQNLEPEISVSGESTSLLLDESIGEDINDENAEDDDAGESDPFIGSVSANLAPLFSYTIDDYGNQSDPGSATASESYGLSLTTESEDGFVETTLQRSSDDETVYLYQGEDGIVYGVTLDGEGEIDATVLSIEVDSDTATLTVNQYVAVEHGDAEDHDDSVSLNLVEDTDLLEVTYLASYSDEDGSPASADTAFTLASVDVGNISIEDDGPTAQLRTPDEGEQPATLVLDESALPEDGDGINTVTEDFSVYFVTDSEGDDETGDLDVDYGTDGPGSVTYSLALSAAGLATQLYALDPSDTETVDDPYGQGDEILLFMNEETGVVEGKTSAESETVYFSISVDENSGEVTFERYENIWHDNTGDHDDPESLQLDELATLKLTQTVEDADGDESAVSINLIGSDSDGDAVTSFTIEDDGPVGSGSSNDASYTGNVLVDAGTDGATVAWSGSTSNGTFSGNEEGGYSYSSTVDDADYAAGTILYDTVSYTITDADGDTTSGSLTFTYEVQNLEPEISVSGESTSLLLDESIGEDINDENAEDDDAGESDPFIGSVSANLAPLFSYTIDDYGNQSDPGSATASESYGLSLTTESEDGFVETTLQRSSDDETVYLYQGEDGIVYGVTLDGEGEIDATVLSIEVDSDTATLTVNQYVAVEHGDAEDHDDSVSLNLVEDTDLLEVTYLASYSDEDGSPASADTAFTLASVDVGNISIEDDGPTAQLRTPDEGEQPATLVLDESALPEDGDGINTVTEDFSVYFVTDSEGDDETGDLDVDYGTDGPGSVTYSLALSAAGLATQLYALDPSDTETVDDPYGQGDEILLFMNEETGVVEGKTSAESETVYFSISVDENSGEVTFERYENIWHDNTGDHDDPESLQLDELATLKLTQTVEDADGDESAVSINLIGSDSDGDAVTSFTIEDDGPVGSGSSNDASYTGNVLVDAGTDGATVAWSGSTSNGTFSGNEEGGYSYSSTVDDADYAAGTILYDTVSYTITDADGDTTSGSLTFTYEVQNLEPEISVSGESTSLLLDESIGEDINDENAEDDDAGESDPFIGSVSANLAPLFSYTIDDYGNQSDPGSATASESYGLSLTTESEDGFVETTLQRSSDDETVYLYQGEDGIVYGVTLDGEGEIDATVLSIEVDSDTATLTVNQYVAVEHGDAEDHDDSVSLNLVEDTDLLEVTYLASYSDEDGSPASADTAFTLASVDVGNISIEDDGPTAQLRTPDEGEQPATLVLDESALPEDGDGINTVTEDFSVYFVTDSEGDDETGDLDVDYGTDGPGSVTYSLALSAAGLATQLYALDPSDTETVDDPYGQGDEILLFMNEETGVVEGKTSAESETVYFSISVDENSGEVTFERYENIWHDNTGDHDDPESLQLDELATLKLTQTVEDADGDESAVSINLVGSDSDGDAVTSFTIEDDGPSEFHPDKAHVILDVSSDVFTPQEITQTLNFNPGTDGLGDLTFSIQDGQLFKDSEGNQLFLDNKELYLYYGENEGELIARTSDADGAVEAFTATIDAEGNVNVTIFSGQFISNVEITTVTDLSGVGGGNVPFKGLNIGSSNTPDPDGSDDVLVSSEILPLGDADSGTVNSNSSVLGVGTGNEVSDGEIIRYDLVTDLSINDQQNQESYSFSGYQDTFVFKQQVQITGGSKDADFILRIYNEENLASGSQNNSKVQGWTDPLTTSMLVLTMAEVRIYNDLNQLQDNTAYVTDNGDGSVTVHDLQNGWWFEIVSLDEFNEPEAFNAVEIEAIEYDTLDAEDDVTSFKLAQFTFGQDSDIEPVNFKLPVEGIDADGDTVTSAVDITVYPDTQSVVGTSGADELVGTDQGDYLFGYEGNDILTGGLGDDVFMWLDGDADGGTDTVIDFTYDLVDPAAENDVLNLADMLDPTGVLDFTGGTDNIDDYLKATFDNVEGTTTLEVYLGGDANSGGSVDQTIIVNGDLQTSLETLLANGNIDVDQ